MTDQITTEVPADSPDIGRHTYDHQSWVHLPGVTVPRELLPHLQSAPSAAPPEPPAPVAREPEVAPESVPAAPEPVREPAPEPAADGDFARAYLAGEK